MNDTGLCTTKNTSECCANYKAVNGKCIHCIGSFGKNCTHPCPYEYYGFGCSKKCRCTWNEFCDPRQGCQTAYYSLNQQSKGNSVPVTVGIVLTVVLLITIYRCYKKRCRITRQSKDFTSKTQSKELYHSLKIFERKYEKPNNNSKNEYSRANFSQSGEAYDTTHGNKDGGILGGNVYSVSNTYIGVSENLYDSTSKEM